MSKNKERPKFKPVKYGTITIEDIYLRIKTSRGTTVEYFGIEPIRKILDGEFIEAAEYLGGQ